MIKKFSLFSSLFVFMAVLLFAFGSFASFTHAQIEPGDAVEVNSEDDGTGISFNDSKLGNPLGEGGVSTLTEFIERALEIIIMIGTPLVVLAIIYSGFLFIAAQGNATKLKNAKATLGWTLLGAVLLFGAYTFSNAIAETVQEIGRGVVTTD